MQHEAIPIIEEQGARTTNDNIILYEKLQHLKFLETIVRNTTVRSSFRIGNREYLLYLSTGTVYSNR